MSAESPRFEAKENTAFVPWTEEELVEALVKLDRQRLANNLFSPYSHSESVARKQISFNGQEYVCHLDYTQSTDVYEADAYNPFGVLLSIECKVGGKPQLKSFPVTFEIDTEGVGVNLNVRYKVDIDGVANSPIATLKTDERGDIEQLKLEVDGEEKTWLFLPADPKLLSTIRVSMSQPQETEPN